MRAGLKKLFFLLIIIGIGYGIFKYITRDKTVKYSFTTSEITRGDITQTVTATGELSALDVVDVGTQVSGRVEKIYVDFNSAVRAGQLIALIDPSVWELQLREAEANLAVSQASLQSALASLNDAEKNFARNKELLNRKLIARSDVDTSEADLSIKKASVQEAKAQVERYKAQLEKARTNLDYTKIISPISGVIIDRNVDAGQTVAASYQTPTLFKIAKDLTLMQIKAKVDEADIGEIAEGQNVTFGVDAFPSENFEGKVVQVRIAPETSDSVVTYTVIINVQNPELKLKPGMTANVSITTKSSRNVLRIPTAALRFTPSDSLMETISLDINKLLQQKKGIHEDTVWTEKDGKLERAVDVVTGISDNKWTELINGELSEGEKLIINAVSTQ